MNSRIAFPFLTLSESAVKASPWSVALNRDDWFPAGDFLADWDSSSTIRLRREFQLDPDIATLDLGISKDDLQLSLGVRIGTGPGRLPRLIVYHDHSEIVPEEWRFTFELEVLGSGLSSVLDITTEFTLSAQVSVCDALSPKRVGDRLWQDRHRIRLEGEEPRFPIEIADLRSLLGDGTAESAPWYLHWSPRDWTRDFHGAIRLFLNRERPEFVERIEAQDAAILQTLMADIMGQVCERLVNEQEAHELIEGLEPGSLGAQAVSWLNHAWPDCDLGFIRSVLENKPGTFRAAFLAVAEIRQD